MEWFGIFKRNRQGQAERSGLASDGEAARQAGNAALQSGDLEKALNNYRLFSDLCPNNAAAHLNCGYVLSRLGRLSEAETALRTAAALDPASHEAQFFLGRALVASQAWSAAESAFAEAARLAPHYGPAWLELGLVRERRKAHGSALQAFEQAIAVQPENLAAWQGKVRAALSLEQAAAAYTAAQRCVELAPNAANLSLQADALLFIGKVEEADGVVRSALRLEPALPPLHLVQASIRLKQDRYDEAVAHYRKYLALGGTAADCLVGFTAALLALGLDEESLEIVNLAATDSSESAEYLYTRGLVLSRLGRFDDALRALRKGHQLFPSHREMQFALSTAERSAGSLSVGWRLYEARTKSVVSGAPCWMPGAPIAGKKVLVLSEQGFGDVIHFARYVPEVVAQGAQVVLQVPPRLKALFEGVWPGCTLISDASEARGIDLYCQLLSLPYLLGRPEPLEMAAPYVRADTSRSAHWRLRLGARKGTRVGLVWSGNREHATDRFRSIPLQLIREHAPESGITFVSLQLDVRESDQSALAGWPALIHFGQEQRDMADSAALIQELDAVLCVDSSVGHLAGALGCPVWLMLPRCPDWRWRDEGERTPWYPQTKLLRQGFDGDWRPVLRRAIQELSELKAQK